MVLADVDRDWTAWEASFGPPPGNITQYKVLTAGDEGFPTREETMFSPGRTWEPNTAYVVYGQYDERNQYTGKVTSQIPTAEVYYTDEHGQITRIDGVTGQHLPFHHDMNEIPRFSGRDMDVNTVVDTQGRAPNTVEVDLGDNGAYQAEATINSVPAERRPVPFGSEEYKASRGQLKDQHYYTLKETIEDPATDPATRMEAIRDKNALFQGVNGMQLGRV